MSASSKIIQAAAGNVAGGGVEPVGIDFDGTNDNLFRSADLVGNSDGKTFTFSAWVYPTDPSDGTTHYIYAGDGTGGNAAFPSLRVSLGSGNLLEFLAENQAGTRILQTSGTYDLAWNTWNHVLISIDLASASNRYVYINDVAQSVTYSTYTNDNIGFSSAQHAIGSLNVGGSSKGRLAGVYLDYTYRDLSVEANRRDFIDENGLYVTPPTSGIISVPMDDPADPGRNDGTGGDFTLNGVVAQSGRGPNQYNAVASDFDGSADYLSRTSLTGASDGKQFTFSAIIKPEAIGDTLFAINDGSSNQPVSITYSSTSSIIAYDASSSLLANIQYTPANFGGVLNRMFLLTMSIDTANQSASKVFINNEEVTLTFATFVDGNIDFTDTNYFIGTRYGTTTIYNGVIGEVYFDTAYIDLATDNPFWDSEAGKPKPVRQVLEETGNTPLIAMPIRGDDAGNNLGTGGDFTVNSGPYVGARGPSEYLARGINVSTSSELHKSGNIGDDSKKITAIIAYNGLSTTANLNIAFRFTHPNGNGINIAINSAQTSGNTYGARFTNSSGTAIFDVDATSPVPSKNEWNIFLLSIDLGNSKEHLFMNNVSMTPTSNIFSDDSVGLTSVTDVRIAKTLSSSFECGFVYFTTDYIDFSQEANRLKFVDAFGYPVDLAPAIESGDIPEPLIYLEFEDPSSLGTNSGTGGDFTVTGTVTAGSDVDPS